MRDNAQQSVVRPNFSRPKGDENGSTLVVRPQFPRPKGDGNGSTSVVRLSHRGGQKIEATRLPQRGVPPSAVHLSLATKRTPTLLPVSRVHLAAHQRERAVTPQATRAVPRFRAKNLISGMFTKQTHHTMSLSLGLTFATGMIGKFATVLLIPMLLLQPLLPVYAADESVAAPESAPVSAPVIVETPVQEAAPITPDVPVESTPPVEETASTDAPNVVPSVDAVGGVTSETTSEEVSPTPPEETLATEEVSGDAPTTEATSEEAPVPPETTEAPGQESSVLSGEGVTETPLDTVSGGDVGTSTLSEPTTSGMSLETAATPSSVGVDNVTIAESEVTTAQEDVVTPIEEAPIVDEAAQKAAEEEAARQAEEARQEQIRQSIKKEVVSEFTKGCLTLDGVGYYCLKNFDGSTEGSLTPSTAVTGVTSQKDPNGNYKQIFITKGGESIQLTRDAWDNTFPSMDVSGKSVVWQGMTEGRWQIFVTNISGTGTPVITQLTHSTESNFNPRVDGDTIVWQGWVNGNWEIFLAERLLPAAYYPLRPDTPQDPGGGLPVENHMLGIDNTWHVSRLTTNETHDMFPAIAGGLVTWQSSQGGSWNVYAYSIKTGATTQLSHDGIKSENPRFAVTWDEHDANGNARMVGYDIASGKTVDMTNEARNTPSGDAPYHPTETPISQPNQAALPPTSGMGTTTTMKVDGDDGGATNTLGS